MRSAIPLLKVLACTLVPYELLATFRGTFVSCKSTGRQTMTNSYSNLRFSYIKALWFVGCCLAIDSFYSKTGLKKIKTKTRNHTQLKRFQMAYAEVETI